MIDAKKNGGQRGSTIGKGITEKSDQCLLEEKKQEIWKEMRKRK